MKLVVITIALAGAAQSSAQLALVTRWPTGDNVCVDAPLRLTFDHPPVSGAAGKIEVVRASDNTIIESIGLGSAGHVDHFGAEGLNYDRYG